MRSSFAQVETCRRLCQAEKEKLRTKASGRPRSSLGCSFMQRPQRVGGLSPTLPQVMGAGQSLWWHVSGGFKWLGRHICEAKWLGGPRSWKSNWFHVRLSAPTKPGARCGFPWEFLPPSPAPHISSHLSGKGEWWPACIFKQRKATQLKVCHLCQRTHVLIKSVLSPCKKQY